MIYEMRTYTLYPGSVREFETKFGESLPYREQHSKLGAFWHTEMGQLNKVIHVWPYDDLVQRAKVRTEASKDPHWPPPTSHLVIDMDTVIVTPAPFMRPLSDQQLGNIYEMRIYTFQPGSMPEVIKRWSEAIPHREKYSPLAACWYTAQGQLNLWYHIWPYKSLAEREKVRAESFKDPHWPPGTGEFMIKSENQLMVPASFSPMK